MQRFPASAWYLLISNARKGFMYRHTHTHTWLRARCLRWLARACFDAHALTFYWCRGSEYLCVARVHTHTHTHKHTQASAHAHTHIHTQASAHACPYAHANTHTHTRTHTYIHTHAYTQVIESLLLILLDLRQVRIPCTSGSHWNHTGSETSPRINKKDTSPWTPWPFSHLLQSQSLCTKEASV